MSLSKINQELCTSNDINVKELWSKALQNVNNSVGYDSLQISGSQGNSKLPMPIVKRPVGPLAAKAFVSDNQLKNGLLPVGKTSAYFPQYEAESKVVVECFDMNGDGVTGPIAGSNVFDDFDFMLSDEQREEDVKAVAVSSSVYPGNQSHLNEKDRSQYLYKIPDRFRSLFPYDFFNKMQRLVMPEVLEKNKNVVICSPTGSGKTVMLEFAIVKVLSQIETGQCPAILYLSPLKSLCAERVKDWKEKLGKIGFQVNELTGDSDLSDEAEIHILKTSVLICSTPEKWDWISRRFGQYTTKIKLVLIDEVHSISADTRGPTLEAVITRMKLQTAHNFHCRFIAVSATAPNVADIGQWLGDSKDKSFKWNSEFCCSNTFSTVFHFDESFRPIPLEKIVIGYSGSDRHNAFSFDSLLNYRLPSVIESYSNGKPCLVFCMSRKSCETSAKHVSNALNKSMNQPLKLIEETRRVADAKLRQLLLQGVAFHHAGLCMSDRQLVEQLFMSGHLPVLFSTSTLAVGVNLPAHLVVIKSTWHCTGQMGTTEEISYADLLQMIGRAGRPQFDKRGRAVVMTRETTKHRYETLLAGKTLIESHLHRRLVEHLNAEMVLGAISTVALALEWIKQTFLYVRLSKNPSFYRFEHQKTVKNESDSVDGFLTSLILSTLDELAKYGLVAVQESNIRSTNYGRLMARHCIALDTMKLIMELGKDSDDSFEIFIEMLSKCAELEDMILRWNERATLNALNKKCRFPVKSGVKTSSAKVSVLIQANLGCLSIEQSALAQDALRIFRVLWRVASCMFEVIWIKADTAQVSFGILQNICLFVKMIKVQLWHDSDYCSKQLTGVGPVLSGHFVRAAKTSFDKISQSKPAELEAICGRHVAFGVNLLNEVSSIPKYEILVSQSEPEMNTLLSITVRICNSQKIVKKHFIGLYHKIVVLIGDSRNNLIGHYRITDRDILDRHNNWQVRASVSSNSQSEPKSNLSGRSNLKVYVQIISLDIVGCDVTAEFEPKFSCAQKPQKSVRFSLDSSQQHHFDALKQFSSDLSKKTDIALREVSLSIPVERQVEEEILPPPPKRSRKPVAKKVKKDIQTKIDGFLKPKVSSSVESVSEESNQSTDRNDDFSFEKIAFEKPKWMQSKNTCDENRAVFKKKSPNEHFNELRSRFSFEPKHSPKQVVAIASENRTESKWKKYQFHPVNQKASSIVTAPVPIQKSQPVIANPPRNSSKVVDLFEVFSASLF